MAHTIIIKHRYADVDAPADLDTGEVAINLLTGTIYVGDQAQSPIILAQQVLVVDSTDFAALVEGDYAEGKIVYETTSDQLYIHDGNDFIPAGLSVKGGTVDGNLDITGTLDVAANATFGDISTSGNLSADGNSDLKNDVTVRKSVSVYEQIYYGVGGNYIVNGTSTVKLNAGAWNHVFISYDQSLEIGRAHV